VVVGVVVLGGCGGGGGSQLMNNVIVSLEYLQASYTLTVPYSDKEKGIDCP